MATLPAAVASAARRAPASKHPVCCALLLALAAGAASAHAGELKVDINNVSRNQVVNTEPGYTMWSPIIPLGNPGTTSTGTNPITQPFTTSTGESLTISFAQTPLSVSRGGTGIIANWFQVGVQNGTSRLAGDGIGPGPVNAVAGGELEMKITGLSAGPHTLLTYHNAVDNPATNFFGPIDIFVNGTLAVDNLQQTIRAATNLAAATAYLEFSVTGPSDTVTILFSADPSPTVSLPTGVNLRRTPFINGFEIDTPNTTRIAQAPKPADFDEHADADTGGLNLTWEAALSGNAVSHDVYFGTNQAAVKNATRASPEFKGTQTTRSYPVAGLNNNLRYYWRIDEIDTAGNTIKGSTWYFRPRHLAFPGAEGYGRHARGGRGGRVVKVTSLEDYRSSETPIPGTLRYAVEQETGPRIIVFDVGGLITLESRLTHNQPYVTIAGQTAPGKGITTRGWPLGFSGARDSVIRYFRNRPGNIAGVTLDGGGLAGCDFSIMDHCSISWAIDEEFSSRTAKDITLQRTLISEALNIAGHQNYPAGTAHGYAATIGGDIGSFHHNLLAHCEGRNWSLGGGLDGSGFFAGRLDIRNNVVYNWRNRTTDGGTKELNFVNNYYKPGAATRHFYALTMNHENDAPGSQRAYFDGNVMPGYFDETNQTAGRRSVVSSGVTPPTYETFVDAPFFPGFVETQTARDAYKRVLSDVSANAPIDDHDVRVIGETIAGTYTYTGTGPYGGFPGLPNSQDDVGGWENYPETHRPADFDPDNDGLPSWWETLKGLNPNSAAGDFSDANADPDGNGYTHLDDYLHWLTIQQAECPEDASVDLNLAALSRGYTDGPIHTIGLVSNGTVTLLADGKTARFTPAVGFLGLAQFDFTVTDAAGSSMTRTVGIRVVAAGPELESFASWIAGYGLPIADQAPGADPEGDGLVNQLEFILGLNPTVPDSEGQPLGKLDGGMFVFAFQHELTADAAFAIEKSTDLATWTPVTGTAEVSGPTQETITVVVPTTDPKLFFRLSSGGFSTVPVGYMTTPLPTTKTTPFGLMLDDTGATPTGLRAAKIESLTATSILHSAGNWTDDLATPAAPWAVRILSGAAAGKLYDITANTATSLTLGTANLTAAGVLAGDRFELVALDTLATFFGSATLQGGTSAATADVVQLRSGATWIAFYYDTALGFWRRTSGAATNCNHTIIRPHSGVLILRRGATLNVLAAGRVLGTSFRTAINNASTTAILAGFPTDTTLGALGLQNLLAGWRPGTTTSAADSVGLYNGTAWTPFVFNGASWQTPAGANSDAIAVPAGTVLLIQRPGSTAGTTDLVREKTY